MKIALSAPIDIHALARFSGQDTEGVAPGWGSTATTPLIEEFVRRGHDVTVFTLSPDLPRSEVHQWGQLRIIVGATRTRHLARNYYKPEIDFLRHAIQTEAPAFVHAHWTYEFALGALRAGVPTLVTIHDLPWNVLRYYRDPHRVVRLSMAYEVALRGRYFTAVSQDAAAHFRRYLKPGAPIAVIPNGLPDFIFDLGAHLSRERITGRVTFATVLSGWSRLKNGTAALEAYALVRRQVPDSSLMMFGKDYGSGGPAWNWASQRSLDEGVRFMGQVDWWSLLEAVGDRVDVIVHPSLSESFSLAALEGMALKKVVVAGGATSGVREVLAGGSCGILVDVREPKQIAAAMVQLAVDAGLRDRIAKKGFDRAQRVYRIETVASQYEAQYQLFRGL